jgi:hypothetical protein
LAMVPAHKKVSVSYLEADRNEIREVLIT